MTIVSYTSPAHPLGAFGVSHGAAVHYCAAALGELLRLDARGFRGVIEAAAAAPAAAEPRDQISLRAPVDAGTEVWAAGVTYKRSMEARVEESTTADVYTMVYAARRPELFFKSIGWRVVTDRQPIAVRRDSPLNVPEPELALVINAHREVVGFVAANDVSSRSIEGDNPLYLPQAKIYAASCALAAGITPSWEAGDPADLAITCRIERAGELVWSAATSTSALHRSFGDLIEALFAEMDFPHGVVLLTGTGIVPDLDTTLLPGDSVSVDIAGIGHLTNPVVSGKGNVALTPPSLTPGS